MVDIAKVNLYGRQIGSVRWDRAGILHYLNMQITSYESPYYADNQHRFIEKNTGKVQILKE